MINFEELFQTVDKQTLQEIGKAMLDGADAKQVKDMFAAAGVELSETDIAKVSGGILAQLAAADETERELADDELDQVAGGCNDGGCKE